MSEKGAGWDTIFNDSTYIEYDSYLSDDASREEFYKVRIPQLKTRADDISFVIDQITAFKTQGFYLGSLSPCLFFLISKE